MKDSKMNDKIGNLKDSVSTGVDKSKDTLKDKYNGSISGTDKKGSVANDKIKSNRH